MGRQALKLSGGGRLRYLNERFPTLVAWVVHGYGHGGITARLNRFAQQRHSGLVGSASPFSRIALHATADDVFPRRVPTQ